MAIEVVLPRLNSYNVGELEQYRVKGIRSKMQGRLKSELELILEGEDRVKSRG